MKYAPCLTIVFVLAAGCASQAGPDYKGELMFSMHGTVSNQLAVAPTRAEVVLDYVINGNAATPTPESDFLTVVPALGTFPSSFTLDLYNPPPDDVVYNYLGLVRAQAGVYVNSPTGVVGMLLDHWLIYVPEDVTNPNPYGVVQYPSTPLTKGYHMLEDDYPPLTPDQMATCVSQTTTATCPTALATAYCAAHGGGYVDASSITTVETPPNTQLEISLGDPCLGPIF
jgi:hypothetical protein